jgi:hypothetical protein
LKEIKKNESVTISSLSNSWSVKGIISLIFPEKNNITQNTKVEILLEENSLFKNWEIVKIDFFPSKIEWIWIPNSSVIQKYNTYGIWWIEDERLKFKKIEKLTQVEEYTLIKWIEIGEKIVLHPSQNFLWWEKVKILQ